MEHPTEAAALPAHATEQIGNRVIPCANTVAMHENKAIKLETIGKNLVIIGAERQKKDWSAAQEYRRSKRWEMKAFDYCCMVV